MRQVGLADVWHDLSTAFAKEGLLLNRWNGGKSHGRQILEVQPGGILLYTRVRQDDGLWGFMDHIAHDLEETGVPWHLLKVHSFAQTGYLVPSYAVLERMRSGRWHLSPAKGAYKLNKPDAASGCRHRTVGLSAGGN